MNPDLVISAAVNDSVLTVRVEGELDIATESPLIERFIAELEAHALDHVVLDVVGVTFIDSSGLRALLLCQRASQERSRSLRLAPGTGAVKNLLKIAGVEGAFRYA